MSTFHLGAEGEQSFDPTGKARHDAAQKEKAEREAAERARREAAVEALFRAIQRNSP